MGRYEDYDATNLFYLSLGFKEFDAYDFWVRTAGTPEVRASKDKENVETGISNHGNPLVYFSKKRENVLVYLSDE